MGRTLLCVWLLLNKLLYGHAQANYRSVLTRQPSWPQLFRGESVTLSCDIQGGGGVNWVYQWWTNSRLARINTIPPHRKYTISSVSESHSGDYRCEGTTVTYSSWWSDSIRLTVLSNRPKAILSADNGTIPAGGSVNLTCSVIPSSPGWNFFFYREEKTCEPRTLEEDFNFSGRLRVSQGGVYCCKAGRGDPVYYTLYSDAVSINKMMANKAVVTLQPNWSEIYRGENITLSCEIEDGGDTEWEYEWWTTRSGRRSGRSALWVISTTADSQSYKCRGKDAMHLYSSTGWSDPVSLTVSDNRPQPVLTVSPRWLSPGDSVTLNCEVERPSAGWSFYWYQAVPGLSDGSYSYELLPGSSNGTEQGSYIVHGQTHTAGYVCRAGRGDPVFHTDYSQPKFVWSGEFHSAASLTVSPSRVQHFTDDSVSLSCDGNSAKWKVSRFSKYGSLTHCRYFSWGTMNGPTCTISSLLRSTAVFWCESETGQFSNAVNLTGQHTDSVILVSPVLPVAEGDSVTLVCELRTGNVHLGVDFYKDDKLVQNGSGRELTIPAVSESDEGFYKCEGKGSVVRWTSPQSWMAVKTSRRGSSLLPVLLTVGLVCGALLIVLLLFRCRKSKDPCFRRPSRSQSNNVITIKQDETQRKESGDACVYESVRGPEDPGNAESSDVTYCLIEFKGSSKNEDSLVYAQVHSHSKAKNDQGTSSPAAAVETVYSEVNTGTASGHSCLT